MEYKNLIEKAFKARKMSYNPYSNFAVGAALLAKNGEIYTGCNIENASYTPTNCAERTAFFTAVSQGVKDFESIAIVGGDKNAQTFDFCPPCGVCRQVMLEFCDPEKFVVILAKDINNYKEILLKDLMPLSFSPKNINK